MTTYAYLELALRRRDGRSYSVELRYNAPDSDADQRLLAEGEGAVEIDVGVVAAALGPQLAQAGIPAVLAMQGNISM